MIPLNWSFHWFVRNRIIKNNRSYTRSEFSHIVFDFVYKRTLTKVGFYNLTMRIQTNCWVQVQRQIVKSRSKIQSIFGVKASVVDEVYPATYNVVCGECGSIWLASTRRAEWFSIITMITKGIFPPARKCIRFNLISWDTNPNISFFYIKELIQLDILK